MKADTPAINGHTLTLLSKCRHCGTKCFTAKEMIQHRCKK